MLAPFEAAAPDVPDSVQYDIINIAAGGSLTLNVYHIRLRDTQSAPSPTSAVIHIHGGGLIACSASVFVTPCSRIVRDTGTQIFSVNYRLAPEHPYPAALDDVSAALKWVRQNASTLGVDIARIAVMGESAGGGLAAALAIRARNEQLSPPIAYQILSYPMLDDRTVGKVPGEIVGWSEDDNVTGWTAYLGHPPGGPDVPETASPARVKDVVGLPRLYLATTQLDLFCRENLTYIQRFIEAGIEVEAHLSPGLPHGFEGMQADHRVGKEIEEHRKRIIRNL
ncbi:Alpha/Beta hydrolase protein [Microdochium bolleyi]|uniref:Alpha/Beta hydrolase protein n=1 Tax=Microdochium bolleyi TaxID=196109 RepID=A0A136IIE3_9PEZI|nr:Alpha/Beta hydrolase protein [Microdochium bolleyi]